MLGSKQKPLWAVEVKWSDRFCDNPSELRSVLSFCRANHLGHVLVTSRTKTSTVTEDSIRINFEPASLYCYTVGYNLIHNKKSFFPPDLLEAEVAKQQQAS
jgi:hypothetical protein